MQPYQTTHADWQEGVYFQKGLTDKEKNRLVHYGKTTPTSPGTAFSIYRAKLDGKTVLAVVPKGEEPADSESQRNLSWTKVIATGRKSLSENQHRTYVEQAVLLGKYVPLDVMACYPELMSLQRDC